MAKADKIRSEAEDILTDLDIANKLIKLHQSAGSRGIEFNLSFRAVKKLLTTKRCFYTGVKFEPDGLLSRSIDRVDSAIGYLDNNVVACTVDINGKKSNLTNLEIEQLHTKLTEWQKTH
jgi:hypothetical protein